MGRTWKRQKDVAPMPLTDAIATGRGERDTAADLRGALPPAKGGNISTITEPKAVGALLRALDGYEGGVVVASAPY